MQFQTLLLLSGSLFAAFTAATDCDAIAAQVPTCSKACMTPALFSKIGCKDERDYKCICAKQAEVKKHATSCIIKHCKGQSLDVMQKAKEVCKCVGA
ncbi:hypothetical protein FKW77_007626 [Venturia effusa]|uniref:CFEM domain-containing protein n=1 Tax=Venturia effusa TaxID=50376 RepID=A0A517KZR7_9PEZI|nr:hypothetical protein FKW77_007626 [Venturia effusa]